MLRRILLLALVMAAFWGLSACGGATSEPAGAPVQPQVATAGDSAAGRKLYAGSCAACHGQAGAGVKGLGSDLTQSAFVAGLSDAELVDFIGKGRPAGDPANTTGIAMPPKGGNTSLNDAQLRDIVAYIRSIQR